MRISKLHRGRVGLTTGITFVALTCILITSPLYAQGKLKDEFPRLSLMFIGGDGHRYHDADVQEQIAKFDVVVLNMYPGWTKGGIGATPNERQSYVLRQIRARNPDIFLANYSMMLESPDRVTGAHGDVFEKLSSERGPVGNGGNFEPNDWWARTEGGRRKSPWPATWKVNITDHVTPDENGDTYPEWFAKRNHEKMFKNVPEWDAIYHDGARYKPRSVVDWDRDGIDDSQDDWGTQLKYRDAMVRQWTLEERLMPNMFLLGNIGTWGQSIVVDYGRWVLDEYDQKLHGGFLEKYMGKSWSLEHRWSWDAMMTSYDETIRRTRSPKLIMLNVGDGDRHGLELYRYFRYGFASTLMNDGYFDFSDSSGYSEIYWFDEYDLAGEAGTSWLGKAIDAPQRQAWTKGVYRRRFENGMAIVNPRGNGTQTVQIEAGYSRIDGRQDSQVNNGSPVSSITLRERDGIVLVKTGIQDAQKRPSPPEFH